SLILQLQCQEHVGVPSSCPLGARIDHVTRPKVSISQTGTSDKHTTIICESNVTWSEALYLNVRPSGKPQYNITDGAQFETVTERLDQNCHKVAEYTLTIWTTRIDVKDHVLCCRGELGLCTTVIPIGLSHETSVCSISEFTETDPCTTSGFRKFPVGRGACLFFGVQFLTDWSDARATCRNLYDSELVRIDSDDLERVIDEQLGANTTEVYIGLYRDAASEFRWLDNDQTITRGNWASDEQRHAQSDNTSHAQPDNTSHAQSDNTSHAQPDSTGSAHPNNRCVYKRPGDWKWVSGRCNRPRAFICQKIDSPNAGGPRLEIGFPFAFRKYYVGRKMAANCVTSSQPASESVVFHMITNQSLVLVHRGHRDFSTRGPEYLRERGRCLERYTASLSLVPQPQWSNVTLVCCMTRPDGPKVCTPQQLEEVYFESQRPELKLNTDKISGYPAVTFGTKFWISCEGFVGTRGQLFMQLSAPTWEYTIQILTNGTVILQDWQNGTRGGSVPVVVDPLRGPFLKQNLTVPANNDMHKAQSYCWSHSPDNPELNTQDKLALLGPIH
ncbi:hypothetical protein EGW08_006033, partial [Elysia chlorotica]